ncbi:MAG TPA: phage holin family protein [Firmicutes bacterium]|nr:phage holin family protein [Bacillota bacterium]
MLGFVIRLIVSAIVLLVVQYVVPGFRLLGFWNALLAAIVIAVIGFVIESVLGKKVSPQARGVVGFISAAVVIYLTQFLVPTMRVSILGALIASVVIGVIDMFVPTELR